MVYKQQHQGSDDMHSINERSDPIQLHKLIYGDNVQALPRKEVHQNLKSSSAKTDFSSSANNDDRVEVPKLENKITSDSPKRDMPSMDENLHRNLVLHSRMSSSRSGTSSLNDPLEVTLATYESSTCNDNDDNTNREMPSADDSPPIQDSLPDHHHHLSKTPPGLKKLKNKINKLRVIKRKGKQSSDPYDDEDSSHYSQQEDKVKKKETKHETKHSNGGSSATNSVKSLSSGGGITHKKLQQFQLQQPFLRLKNKPLSTIPSSSKANNEVKINNHMNTTTTTTTSTTKDWEFKPFDEPDDGEPFDMKQTKKEKTGIIARKVSSDKESCLQNQSTPPSLSSSSSSPVKDKITIVTPTSLPKIMQQKKKQPSIKEKITIVTPTTSPQMTQQKKKQSSPKEKVTIVTPTTPPKIMQQEKKQPSSKEKVTTVTPTTSPSRRKKETSWRERISISPTRRRGVSPPPKKTENHVTKNSFGSSDDLTTPAIITSDEIDVVSSNKQELKSNNNVVDKTKNADSSSPIEEAKHKKKTKKEVVWQQANTSLNRRLFGATILTNKDWNKAEEEWREAERHEKNKQQQQKQKHKKNKEQQQSPPPPPPPSTEKMKKKGYDTEDEKSLSSWSTWKGSSEHQNNSLPSWKGSEHQNNSFIISSLGQQIPVGSSTTIKKPKDSSSFQEFDEDDSIFVFTDAEDTTTEVNHRASIDLTVDDSTLEESFRTRNDSLRSSSSKSEEEDDEETFVTVDTDYTKSTSCTDCSYATSAYSVYSKSMESEVEDVIKDLLFIGTGKHNAPGKRSAKYKPENKYKSIDELMKSRKNDLLAQIQEGSDTDESSCIDWQGRGKNNYLNQSMSYDSIEVSLANNKLATSSSSDTTDKGGTSGGECDIVISSSSNLKESSSSSADCINFLRSKSSESTDGEQPLECLWGYIEGGLNSMTSVLGLSSTPSSRDAVEEEEPVDKNEKDDDDDNDDDDDDDDDNNSNNNDDNNNDKSNDVVPEIMSESFTDDTINSLKSCESTVVTTATGQTRDIFEYASGLLSPSPKSLEEATLANESVEVTDIEQRKKEEAGIFLLAGCAARAKHEREGLVYDESEVDVCTEIKFSVITIPLPLGLLLQENSSGCSVTRIFRSGNAAKTARGDGVEVGDQLTAVNGKNTIGMNVIEICNMISFSPNPKEVELSFLRYIGPFRPLTGRTTPATKSSNKNIAAEDILLPNNNMTMILPQKTIDSNKEEMVLPEIPSKESEQRDEITDPPIVVNHASSSSDNNDSVESSQQRIEDDNKDTHSSISSQGSSKEGSSSSVPKSKLHSSNKLQMMKKRFSSLGRLKKNRN